MSETRVVNKYKEPYDVYIGRGGKWGNQYTHHKALYTYSLLLFHSHSL